MYLGNESFPFSVIKSSMCDFTWKGCILKHFLGQHWWGWYTEHGQSSGRWPVTATSGPGQKQSTSLSPVHSPPLFPTFLPGTQTNGWASGSVFHLEETTWCLKHYSPVEITQDDLVFAPSYLSSSPGCWIHHVLNMRIWKKVWSLLLCTGFLHEITPWCLAQHLLVNTSLRLKPDAPTQQRWPKPPLWKFGHVCLFSVFKFSTVVYGMTGTGINDFLSSATPTEEEQEFRLHVCYYNRHLSDPDYFIRKSPNPFVKRSP